MSAGFAEFIKFPHPVKPVPPDFQICDPLYGKGLSKKDCKQAARNLARGSRAVSYDIDTMSLNHVLPYTTIEGDCQIIVEVAGGTKAHTVTISPDSLRGMAGWVISACVNKDSMGGFVTQNVGNLMTFLEDPVFSNDPPYPANTAFITLTITNKADMRPSPGDYDPSMALLAAAYVDKAAMSEPMNSPARSKLKADLESIMTTGRGMTRGGHQVAFWQQIPETPKAVAYVCDPDLGTPNAGDCTDVSQNQVRTMPESVTLQPGVISFHFSDTCVLAVGADTVTTLRREQIQSAVDTLMNVCITNPTEPQPMGGRAFYGAQPQSQRRKRQEGAVGQYTGLDALPPGVNVTIFQQTNATYQTDAMAEAASCPWQAVMNGLPISSCQEV